MENMTRKMTVAFCLGVSVFLISACGGSGGGVDPAQIKALDATGANGKFQEAGSNCDLTDDQVLAGGVQNGDSYTNILQVGNGQIKYSSSSSSQNISVAATYNVTKVEGENISLSRSGLSFSGDIPGQLKQAIDQSMAQNITGKYQKDSKIFRLTFASNDCRTFIRQ